MKNLNKDERNTVSTIKEYNAKITPSKYTIIITGGTGVGKSTLSQLLSEQELEAHYLKKAGVYYIDRKENSEGSNSPVGHKAVSNTIIPNKIEVLKDDIQYTIWDEPGYRDPEIEGGSKSGDEITTSFLNLKTFANSEEVKILLCIPYSAMEGRGGEFVNAVKTFAAAYQGVLHLLDKSVGIIVTKVPLELEHSHIMARMLQIAQDKKSSNMDRDDNFLKIMEFFYDDKKLLNEDEEEFFNDEKSSKVHLFHKPTSAGDIPVLKGTELFNKINATINFIPSPKYDIEITLTKEAQEEANKLVRMVQSKIETIINIINEAVRNLDLSTTSNNSNIFINSQDEIKDLLPKYTKINYKAQSIPTNAGNLYFTHLAQHTNLYSILTKKDDTNIEGIIKVFCNILENVGKFIPSGDQKLIKIIGDFLHVLEQQSELLKFLEKVCPNDLINLSSLKVGLNVCFAIVDEKWQTEINNINLTLDNSNVCYFLVALEYLEKNKNGEGNPEKIAKCYSKIGDLFFASNNYDQALYYYQKTLLSCRDAGLLIDEGDIKISAIYQKVGEIYYNKSKEDGAYYSEAIKYFESSMNFIMIQECYRKILKKDPQNIELRMTIGQYFQSKKLISEAAQCFKEVISLAVDDGVKFKAAILLSEVAYISSANISEFWKKTAEQKKFFDHAPVSEDDLKNSVLGLEPGVQVYVNQLLENPHIEPDNTQLSEGADKGAEHTDDNPLESELTNDVLDTTEKLTQPDNVQTEVKEVTTPVDNTVVVEPEKNPNLTQEVVLNTNIPIEPNNNNQLPEVKDIVTMPTDNIVVESEKTPNLTQEVVPNINTPIEQNNNNPLSEVKDMINTPTDETNNVEVVGNLNVGETI